ncbi:MAG: DUF58 domain-containing protein [Lachnospiraceae bacterium]|nr:DUF58 domain-containing protein [Lachnospiraceae bacterium]
MRRIRKAAKKILPSVLWVIGLIVCFIPALFMVNPAGYFPLLAYLFATLVSGLYLLGLRKSLEWEEGGGTATVRRGTRQSFGLVLHNRGPLVYPSLKVRLRLSDLFGGTDSTLETEMALVPFERRQMDMNISFTHIGDYTVSVDRVSIGDLIGLFKRTGDGGAAHGVQVLPHIWRIYSFPLSHQVNNENPLARQSSDREGMDYVGVREYAQGDPIKSIHWKLSAHTLSYMTKQMTTIGMTGLAVVIDLYSSREEAEARMELYDALVEGTCALCAYALKNHLDHELFYFDRDGMRKTRAFQREEELDRLAADLPKVVPDKHDYPVEQLLHRCAVDLYGKNNVALVTSEVTTETIELLTRIHLRGRYPSLLFVLPKGLTELEEAEALAPLRSLDAYRIPWFAYSDPAELEGGSMA